ncbi:MAG: anaerobic sulfatase-maturation protein [Prevotella sp.]|nr:anaerobic sulfatase-maturation protein [Prevotella sp.]
MLKPVGSRCNLACTYCYYRDKGHELLSEGLLEEFTRQYLEAQTMSQVLFTWHGGEPLLRPLSFYRKALELQRCYGQGLQIDNCIQTNGTLLTDEWCEFLRENNFLVGISIDGPEPLNVLRTPSTFHHPPSTFHHPPSTFHQIMRGIGLLQKHGVQWNAMATVNAANVDHPVEFYRFFRDIGCQFLQFTPVVERGERMEERGEWKEERGERKEESDECITPQQWGRFLCAVYDEWVRRDVGQIFVQLFDATLANWVGESPGVCSMAPTCGHAAVMEADGSVYSCDHFVFPEYRLGNIKEKTLTEMLYGERQLHFGLQKRDALPRQCRECEFLFACNGECPKNRFTSDRCGNPGLNYLCEGYRQFFSHVAADMDFMAAELRAGRAPANIMLTSHLSPHTS